MGFRALLIIVAFALVAAGCSSSVEDDLLSSIPSPADVDDGASDADDGDDSGSDDDSGGFSDGGGLFNPDTGLPTEACLLLSLDEIEGVTGIVFGDAFGNPFQCTYGDITTGQAWTLLFFRTGAFNNGDGSMSPTFEDDMVIDNLGDRALWTPNSETMTIQIGNAIAGVSGRLFNGDAQSRMDQATELVLLVLSKTN